VYVRQKFALTGLDSLVPTIRQTSLNISRQDDMGDRLIEAEYGTQELCRLGAALLRHPHEIAVY